MSYKLVNRIIEEVDLPGMEKLLLMVMARYAKDDGGNCKPSNATLASNIGKSERTVKRLKRHLEQAGVLQAVGGGIIRAGRGIATEYRILLENAPKTPDLPPNHDNSVTPKPRQRCHPSGRNHDTSVTPKPPQNHDTSVTLQGRNHDNSVTLKPPKNHDNSVTLQGETMTKLSKNHDNSVTRSGHESVKKKTPSGMLRIVDEEIPDEESTDNSPAELPGDLDGWLELALAPKANAPAVVVSMIEQHYPRQMSRWEQEGVRPFSAVGRLVGRKGRPFTNWAAAVKALWWTIMEDPPKGDLINWVVGKNRPNESRAEGIAALKEFGERRSFKGEEK